MFLLSMVKRVFILFWGAGVISILVMAFSFSIDLPFNDIFLFCKSDNYFWFNGKRLVLFLASPFMIFAILYYFIAIISKNYRTSDRLSYYISTISIVSLVVVFFDHNSHTDNLLLSLILLFVQTLQ